MLKIIGLEFGMDQLLVMGIFIISMFVFSFKYYFKLKKDVTYESYLPEAVAALGILGTFAGITMGLLKFDPDQLEVSIKGLLEGMKTAFFTSLLGLGLSTVLKAWGQSKKRRELAESDSVEEKLSELIDLMKASDNSILANAVIELKNSTMTSNNRMVKSMETMEKSVSSLVSEDERSLVSQMSNLRSGMISAQNEAQERLNSGLNSMGEKLGDLVRSNNTISNEIERGNKELIGHFVGFRDEMAKAFTEEFTQALTRSIEDLNTQLQEQLGENFKNAVNKLVDWQEHYVDTIKNTTVVLDKTMKAIQSTEKSMEHIAERSDSLIRVSEELEPTIKGLDTIQGELAYGMDRLSEVSGVFEERMPQLLDNTQKLSNEGLSKINDTLDKLRTFGGEFENITQNTALKIERVSEKLHGNIEVSLGKVMENSDEMLKVSEKAIASNEEINESLTENINIVIKRFEERIAEALDSSIKSMENNSNLMGETAKAQVANMEEVNQKIASSYEQIIAALSEQLKEVFEKSGTAMNESIAKLEETLENNLDNSLAGLTGALGQVSEKFVDDYMPLTEKLKKVIEIAKEV